MGGRQIRTPAYADDVVLLAKDERGMQEMLKRSERYLERKELELNTEKTKVMRFKKGGGRDSKRTWTWRGKDLEEVKESKYLGFVLTRNGGMEKHVRDRWRKATVVMAQVWGIGKRKFGGDWGRRSRMYSALVESVAMYGAEIWGWEERECMERLQEKFIRWTLELDSRTPGYMVREETKRDEVRTKARRRAMKYEKKLREGGGNDLARKCGKEIQSGKAERRSKWEEKRRKFYEERGFSAEKVERRREKGESIEGEREERDREVQGQEKEKRIRVKIQQDIQRNKDVRHTEIPQGKKK